ncbi:MAG: ABC transporter permease subunit [Oligosphaeraceae bacterium]|nr:ABC transporter permease subunit [Oligosphaeraceae bacterium]
MIFRKCVPAGLILVLLLVGCSRQEKKTLPEIASATQLNAPEYCIGLPTGAAAMSVGESFFAKAKKIYVNSHSDAYVAVSSGKIDAYLYDRHCLEHIVKKHPELALLPEKIADENIVVGITPSRAELLPRVNAFIDQYRADGTYQAMYERWITGDNPAMPQLAVPPKPALTIRVGTCGLEAPMSYYGSDGKLLGFDAEFIQRLGLALNARVEITAMTYDALIPAAESGKLDLLIASLNDTPERRKFMLLSQPYIDSAICLVLKKDRLEKAKSELDAFSGQAIASLAGTVFDLHIDRRISNVKHQYFNDLNSMLLALRSGKVAAVGVDEPVGRLMAARFPEFEMVPEAICVDQYGFAICKGNPLTAKASSVVRKLKTDGTLQEMQQRWFSAGKEEKSLPVLSYRPDFDGSGGVLRFHHDNVNVPMSYVGQDNISLGFDVELAARIAYELNMVFKPTPCGFSSLLETLMVGKTDMVGGAMSITPERQHTVDFTDGYYTGGIYLLRRKEPAAGGEISLAGKRVGVLTGSVGELYIERSQPAALPSSFDTFSDAVSALRSGKLEYVLGSYTSMLNYTLHDQALMLLPDKLSTDANAIAVKKGNRQLLEKLNGVLENFRRQGLLQQLEKRWLRSSLTPYEIPDLPARGADAPLLRVGIAADREPICFLYEGRFAGLDWELIERIAYELGMRVEYQNMKFSGLLAALQSGKVDLVIANMTHTAERAQKVDFTLDYFCNPQTLLTRKELHGQEQSDWDLLTGKKIGVLTGSVFDQLQQTLLPDTIPEYYDSYPDMVLAVQTGKLAGLIVDDPLGRVTVARQPGLHILKKPLADTDYAFAFAKQNTELCAKINRVLQEMKQDGTWKRLEEIWFGGDDKAKAPPELFQSGTQGVLRVVVEPTMEPFSYLKDGKLAGYDLDMLNLIAQKLDLSLEVSATSFSAIIPAVISGKADLAASGLCVTAERAQNVLFSDPNYQGKIVLVVSEQLQDGKPQSQSSVRVFLGKLRQSFHSTFLLEARYKLVLKGLWVTILVSLCAILLGTLLGFLVCLLRRSQHKIASIPAKVYIRCLQGTPILVLLMLMYYVVFGHFDANAILIAILSFAMNFAAYSAEMFRTGIAALDHGQIEAAQALGFQRLQVLRRIILPQAARHVLPVFKGEVISTVKMTSVVGYIAIQDLTKVSDIIRSRTYEAFFPLIATALIYFTFSGLLTSLLSLLERKIDPAQRKRVLRGVEVKA